MPISWFLLLAIVGNGMAKPVGVERNLSAAQKKDVAYLRKAPDNTWRVLVICMLLNTTSGGQTRKILSDFFTLCPDAKTASEVSTEDIEKIIETLGFQKKRPDMIQPMSEEMDLCN